MTNYICYHNGEFVSESDVSISFRDLGFQRAYGVFDYLRTYKHKPFQKEWHAEKLIHSISEMNIDIDFSESDFLSLLDGLFKKNDEYLNTEIEYGIKTIVTGGVDGVSTIIMYLEELDDYYHDLQGIGISLLAKRVPRQEASSKNTDYKTLIRSNSELIEKGCLEILHRGDTYVYEAGTSNIFIVKDGAVITPSDRIYKGSTREYVLNIIKENDFKYEERFIAWDEFIEADEIFITASKKEILPVVKIYNDVELFEFEIGKHTKKLIDLFNIKKQV